MNTIIEKIRAEVNKLPEEYKGLYKQFGNSLGFIDGLDMVKKILSDLEKEEKPSEGLEEEIREFVEQEWDGLHDNDGNPLYTADYLEYIARHFYELGCRRTAEKYDEIEYNRQRADVCDGEEEEYEQIKQKVCSDCPGHKDDYCGYVKRQLQRKCNYLSDVMYGYELGRQSKPKVSEGLEEEISRYLRDDCSYDDEPSISKVARHFAQWGAEHAREQIMKDGNVILAEEDFDAEKEKSMERGYNLCKEQMLNGAVEGYVTMYANKIYPTLIGIRERIGDTGDKVKLIIVKED